MVPAGPLVLVSVSAVPLVEASTPSLAAPPPPMVAVVVEGQVSVRAIQWAIEHRRGLVQGQESHHRDPLRSDPTPVALPLHALP